MCVGIFICMQVPRGQKGASDHLELELTGSCEWTDMDAGNDLRYSARAACALNPCATSPAL